MNNITSYKLVKLWKNSIKISKFPREAISKTMREFYPKGIPIEEWEIVVCQYLSTGSRIQHCPPKGSVVVYIPDLSSFKLFLHYLLTFKWSLGDSSHTHLCCN